MTPILICELGVEEIPFEKSPWPAMDVFCAFYFFGRAEWASVSGTLLICPDTAPLVIELSLNTYLRRRLAEQVFVEAYERFSPSLEGCDCICCLVPLGDSVAFGHMAQSLLDEAAANEKQPIYEG